MPHLFILLLKINLVLVLFAAAYYLILRRLTFYTINRAFLVFGILFSSVYPFINLTDFFHRQKQINQKMVAFVPQLNQKVNELVPANFITSNWGIISILFYLGVVLMAFRLLVQFFSLYQMHRKSAPGAIADYKVRILSEPVSPFSFWQTVYINPSLHQEKELQTILAHEQVHVRQWHSLDIILAELSVVFYWFNPGVWLMKKAVKENLEFITDQKILNKGIDRKAYQYSLLDVGNLNAAVAIVNNFNLSDLKKRIKMMNVKRSSRLTLSRYLLITPVLLVSTLAFTVSKKDIKKHLMPLRQVLVDHQLMSAPKAAPVTTIASHLKKKKTAMAVPSPSDSIQKMKILINHLLINDNDTLHMVTSGEIKNKEVFLRRIEGMPKLVASSYSYQTDSLPKGRSIKNVQFSFKTGQATGEHPDEDKVVVVKGYGRTAKADSTLRSGQVIYFLNGKRITEDEFKNKISPEDLKSVTLSKEKVVMGVRIDTKDKPL
ncbi:MAG: M56 family metallopeptidase [Pedobacter sp.]|nr:M56 family metallopeptidase [Pedobacter sp.]MDQ8051520.1 M56 family metallopeptidase [Pedobacter sp.]